jgi:cell wall-associated NlpC family hydrolase
MYDFQKDDFLTSGNLSKAILRSGQSERRIKKTSINELGHTRSSLTTTDIGEALTGALETRNLFYSQNFLQTSVKSSLDSIITSFVNDESITIESPEGYGTLSGSLAANRILAESLVFKKGFESFGGRIDSDLSNLTNASFSEYQSSFEAIANSASTSAGAMPVALESILSDQGSLNWYRSRHTYLKSKMQGEFDVPVNGFNFRINNSSSDGNSGSVTITNFPGLNQSSSLDQSLVSEDIQKAYLSAALMELLIFLEAESGIILGGSFGTSRASSPDRQKSGFQARPDSISDHVFGRAFDIQKIGRRGSNLSKISEESTQYRQQLEVFLEALNTVPEHLMPDLIVLHPNLSSIYQITDGFEDSRTQIKLKYPRLKYVDFETSQEHRGHIHISFSGERAGIYTGPSGRLIQVTNTSTSNSSTRESSQYQSAPFSFPELTVEDIANWYRNYYNSPGSTISRESLFELLRATIMTDESAALFIGIVVRESGLRPVSINGGWRLSSGNYSGEYSIGLFQINLRTTAHGAKKIHIPRSGTGSSYDTDAWRLSCLNHPEYSTLNTDNIDLFLRNTLGKVNEKSSNDADKIAYANIDVWIPYNQVSLLYTVITGATWSTSAPKLDPRENSSHIFSPWGDYSGGKGFLSGVNYDNVMNMYLRTGKTEEQFQQWFKSWFTNTSIVSAQRRALNERANPTFIQRVNTAPAIPSYYSGPRVVNARDFPYPSPRTIGEIAVNIAFGQILKPYETGRNGEVPPNVNEAFDCSGLTRYAWYFAVKYYNETYNQTLPVLILPTNSKLQGLSDLVTPVSLGGQPPENVLQAGDLIIKDGHVAMYMGGTSMIHALNEQVGIVVDNWLDKQRFNGTSFTPQNFLRAPGASGFWRDSGNTVDPQITYVRVLDVLIPSPLPFGGFVG